MNIEGDTNRDGLVDSKDVKKLSEMYNSKEGDSEYLSGYDMNNDGIIDIYDIVKISSKL